jgi:small nuclear ribonucleoprotein (snRNP)-like protein
MGRAHKDSRMVRPGGKAPSGEQHQRRRGAPSRQRETFRERRSSRPTLTSPPAALEVGPWAGRRVQVTLAGGRCIVGKLIGWDALANLVLDDAWERFQGAIRTSTQPSPPALTMSVAGGIGMQPQEVSDVYTRALEGTQAGLEPGDDDGSGKSLLLFLPNKSPAKGYWERQLGRVVLRGPSVATLGPLEESIASEAGMAPTTYPRAKSCGQRIEHG